MNDEASDFNDRITFCFFLTSLGQIFRLCKSKFAIVFFTRVEWPFSIFFGWASLKRQKLLSEVSGYAHISTMSALFCARFNTCDTRRFPLSKDAAIGKFRDER